MVCLARQPRTFCLEQNQVNLWLNSQPRLVFPRTAQSPKIGCHQCPNAVVLFDEVEKAHPDILTGATHQPSAPPGRGSSGKSKSIQTVQTVSLSSFKLCNRTFQNLPVAGFVFCFGFGLLSDQFLLLKVAELFSEKPLTRRAPIPTCLLQTFDEGRLTDGKGCVSHNPPTSPNSVIKHIT